MAIISLYFPEKRRIERLSVKTQYLANTLPYQWKLFLKSELGRGRTDFYFRDREILYQLSY